MGPIGWLGIGLYAVWNPFDDFLDTLLQLQKVSHSSCSDEEKIEFYSSFLIVEALVAVSLPLFDNGVMRALWDEGAAEVMNWLDDIDESRLERCP